MNCPIASSNWLTKYLKETSWFCNICAQTLDCTRDFFFFFYLRIYTIRDDFKFKFHFVFLATMLNYNCTCIIKKKKTRILAIIDCSLKLVTAGVEREHVRPPCFSMIMRECTWMKFVLRALLFYWPNEDPYRTHNPATWNPLQL